MENIRHDWKKEEALALMDRPLMDLLLDAQTIHRQNFEANQMQLSTLVSIKTGGCPEDCSYCGQAARYNKGVIEKLKDEDTILEEAKKAKAAGATRFCMGAAWRGPKDRHIEKTAKMISAVKALGLETCATFGLLSEDQAVKLKEAGLDYYNHNIDTSPEYYPNIISTRCFQDRLDTLDHVRNADIKVCCGGILGLGESREDRASMLCTLANMPKHPDSVPMNMLAQTPGTPLEEQKDFDNFEFIKSIAVARIMMPKSYLRLSGGRYKMSPETQALCIMAGVNSIHCAREKLFLTENPDMDHDKKLMQRLGLIANV